MVDRTLFIEAMRHVAQSVTVVTTKGKNGAAGATVSAFSSLSADPPSVLICLRSDSRIALAVNQNKAYCVNILPEGAGELAERFAGRFDIEQPDRFGAIKCVDGPSGAILDGATAFDCALEKIISHGSHDICIGNVTAITHRGTRPLAYMDGSFQIVRPVTKIATE
jgi:flavin reductase (DIM6/NTAB) family NADH-FMN oxidoreductase RutF